MNKGVIIISIMVIGLLVLSGCSQAPAEQQGNGEEDTEGQSPTQEGQDEEINGIPQPPALPQG